MAKRDGVFAIVFNYFIIVFVLLEFVFNFNRIALIVWLRRPNKNLQISANCLADFLKKKCHAQICCSLKRFIEKTLFRDDRVHKWLSIHQILLICSHWV